MPLCLVFSKAYLAASLISTHWVLVALTHPQVSDFPNKCDLSLLLKLDLNNGSLSHRRDLGSGPGSVPNSLCDFGPGDLASEVALIVK